MSDRTEDSEQAAAGGSEADSTPYRVLARKYRPASFADLIGQEAVVRTLTNAIAAGRIAHAYILTGVRGVGKTTSARILARALNCIGADGSGTGPTAEPCGVCEHCRAIAEDRHVDVLEMDAASRTGIDDIRELIEGIRYRPVSARHKVYIVDEVHMLSRQAFNGLLKTLEEPPEHVIFIFATTEIRKVPVTVLSRCQRFDLRRIDEERLAAYFADIAGREGIEVAPAAMALIARAADGSARDGLSLLDQAIALSGGARSGGRVEEDQVKGMLGLADRTRVFDLFEAVMGGRIAEALDHMADLYAAGADPAVVLQDLLELTHFLTRAKLVPRATGDAGVPEAERARGKALADKLGMGNLARTWQILLKGLGEVRYAPSPIQAAEMVLIRLAHASDQPTPAELVRALSGKEDRAAGKDGGGREAAQSISEAAASEAPTSEAAAPEAAAPEAAAAPPAARQFDYAPGAGGGAAAAASPESRPQTAPEATPAASRMELRQPEPQDFAELVALARARKEGLLARHLEHDVHLVRFEPGAVEFRPGERAPRDLAGRLGRLLQDWTGTRWMVSVSGEPGEAPLGAQREAERKRRLEAAAQHPLTREVLARFPGARIVDVRGPGEKPSGHPEPDHPEPDHPEEET